MIFAVTNAKGGIGKTTVAVNIAAGFADKGRPTLLIDLDPQGHASRCFVDGELERDVSDLIMDKPSLASKSVIPTEYPSLHIVPATIELTETAELLSSRIRREERLLRALDPLREPYKNIIIDCPPSLGILTYNAIHAADLLIIPIQPGMGAVMGIAALLEAAQELRDETLVPYRILINMFDIRTSRTNAIIDELIEDYRQKVFRTIISKSEALNQANIAGEPVWKSMRNSKSAEEFDALCEEILKLRLR
ncbi:MAG: ParA family protein [Deltaproteobacteria bacterium]|nr:ParA family protein [Deltaproteobacteria bacterium]